MPPGDTFMTLTETAEAIRNGRASAAETIERSLTTIDSLDGGLGAFLATFPDRAREKAAEVDRRIAAGKPVGPLAGVPVAVKDNMCTTFGHTTCGSRILANFASPYDAHVVQRLEAADAIIVGKTNLDEFAMGSSNENSAFKPARNPWDPGRVPGGSSGGSTVAVCTGMVCAALGSDTGGSIRQPASLCGVVGLKPTYGRVSRYGLVAFASSLDQIGPLTRTVRDAALMLKVIAGHDARDSTCVNEPPPEYVTELERPIEKLRIGVMAESLGEGLNAEVRKAVEAAIDVYRGMGAQIVDVSVPSMQYAIACYYLVATAEASSNLARYDGVHYGHRTSKATDHIELYSASREEGFGPEVKRRIMLGTYGLSSGYYDAFYLKALKVRTLIRQDFERAFEKVNVILSPTSPTTAFRIGEKADDPLAMYLADIYTVSVNLAGIPGISIPCGFDAAGLPAGLQLIARAFDESTLLRAAHAYQMQTEWHTRVPPVARSAAR